MIEEAQLQSALENVISTNGKGHLHLPWLTQQAVKFYEVVSWTAVLPESRLIRTIASVPLSSLLALDIHRTGMNLITAIDRDNKAVEISLTDASINCIKANNLLICSGRVCLRQVPIGK